MTTYRPNPQTNNNPYQNRYRRDGNFVLDKVFSSGPYIVAIISFLIAVNSLVALLGVDLVAGKYIGDYMAPSDDNFAIFWTLATTGIPLALIGVGLYGWRERWPWQVVVGILIVGLIPMAIDCWYDGLAGDIIRFGKFINIEDLPVVEQLPHRMFRVMLGTASLVGEPVAAASVIIFPIMRELFNGVFRNG